MCTLYLSACSTTADGDLQVQQQAQPAVSPGQNQEGMVGKTRPVVSPQQNSDGVSGNTCSGLGSCLHSSPLVPRYQDYLLSSTSMKLLSQTVATDAFPSWSLFRNSSPNHAGGNLTAQAHKIDLSRGTGFRTGEGKEGGNASGGICNLLFAILSDLSCGDRRAPGCEKKVHSLNIF